MNVAVAILILILGQTQKSDQVITAKELPFVPLDSKQMVVANEESDLEFLKVPESDQVFDPGKVMPSVNT